MNTSQTSTLMFTRFPEMLVTVQLALISHWVLTPEGAKRVIVFSWLTWKAPTDNPAALRTSTVPLTTTLNVRFMKTGVAGGAGLGGTGAGVELTRVQLVPMTVQPPETTVPLIAGATVAVAARVSAWKQES